MKSEWLKKIVSVKNSLKTGGLIVGGAVLLAGMVFSGCSEESGSDTPPQLIIFDEDGFMAEISEAKDIFDLAAIRDDYRLANEQSARVDQAIEERWEEFLEGVEPIGSISDEAELIIFKSEPTPGGRVRISFLFKTDQKIEADYIIYQHAYPTKEFRNILPEDRKQYGFINRGFTPIPPTLSWPSEDYVVLITEPILEPAVYDWRIGFYKSGGGSPGIELDLGKIDARK